MLPSRALCLDANIFIASCSPQELGHRNALEIMRVVDNEEWPLLEPAIAFSEIASGILRKKREGALSDPEASAILERFSELPLLLLGQPSLMIRASQYVSQLSFKSFYDASYLATAVDKAIPLITLDGELIKKGRRVYGKIYSPEEFLKIRSRFSSPAIS